MFMTSPDQIPQTPQHNQLPPFPDPEQQRNFDTAVTNIREWLEPAAARHYDYEGKPVDEGITHSVTFTKFAASRYMTKEKEERLRVQTVHGPNDDGSDTVFSLNPKAVDPNQRGLMFREFPGGEPYTGGGYPPVEMTPDDYAFLVNEVPRLYNQGMATGDFAYPTQISRPRSRLLGLIGLGGRRKSGNS